MRRHRHHWGHRRPPLRWILARGVHRHVVRFLFVAALLGATAGALMQWGWAHNAGPHVFCLGATTLLLLWPLGWFASVRIAWPLQRLAARADAVAGGRVAPERVDGPEEVEVVSDALDGLAERLSTQLSAQRALLGTVSHELRSPLARARVLVELGREGAHDAHDELQREIDGMDRLVGDLLAVSRIDFDALSVSSLDVHVVVARALEVSGVSADVHIDVDAVDADATLLVRALVVLLDNARRYGAEPISLEVGKSAGEVVFSVRDHGPGLPDSAQPFEPFWRGQDGPGGTGLGLALVRRIAEVHGGAARVGTGPGTTFVLSVPA